MKYSVPRLLFVAALFNSVCFGEQPCGVANDAVESPKGDQVKNYSRPYLYARDEFVDSEPGLPKGRAARKLFAEATPDIIQDLRFDSDAGVAVSAAWQSLRLQMIGRLAGVDRSAHFAHVSQAITREFLGFVEGRLRVPAPDGWAQIVRGTRFSSFGEARFPVGLHAYKLLSDDPFEGLVQKWEVGRVSAPRLVITLDKRPGELRFMGGSRFEGETIDVQIPEKLHVLMDRWDVDVGLRLSGIATTTRAMVVQQDLDEGIIACIAMDEQGEKPDLKWTQKIDAFWSNPQASEFFSELRVADGQVFLFHSTNLSVGAEAFTIEDGKRTFSFNSRLPDERR